MIPEENTITLLRFMGQREMLLHFIRIHLTAARLLWVGNSDRCLEYRILLNPESIQRRLWA